VGAQPVFVVLPCGIFLIAGATAIAFSDADVGVGTGVMTVIALVGLTLSIVWMFKPPEFMKPRWVREVEHGTAPAPALPGAEGAPGPSGARRIYLPPAAYWSLCGLTAAVFMAWLVFDWSWGVLVGIGTAISTLAVSTPRKGTRDPAAACRGQ
jgi:hypothetical protein